MIKRARMISPLVAILIVLLMFSGCGSNDNDVKDNSDSEPAVTVIDDSAVLAKVGEDEITSKLLREFMVISAHYAGKKIDDYSKDQLEELRANVLESAVTNVVIRQHLESLGVEGMSQEVVASAENVAARIYKDEGLLKLVEDGEVSKDTFAEYVAFAQYRSWFYTNTMEALNLTQEILREYYEKNPDSFMRTYVDISHIMVANVDEAALVFEELEKGEDFASLADKYSKDIATRGEGGRLGPIGKNEIWPELEEAAFSMEIGEVRGPIRSMYGQSILLLHDRFQELLSFDVVEEYIIDIFVAEAANEKIKELRKGTSIPYL